MTTFRAHFNGKVLIPDGPVDLPTDRPLELQAKELPSPPGNDEGPFPTFPRQPGDRIIRSEDIRHLIEEDL